VPSLPAHPLRADATADPSFGRLIAMSRHSICSLRPIPNDRDRPKSAIQVRWRERPLWIAKRPSNYRDQL